ncbi:hypothetical protein N6H14_12680 [Paenibacillus sp. CC-CFT747]|nr:hypothetical protein N6H14_12680 [Paenibacillus sp. CC-CFT747]
MELSLLQEHVTKGADFGRISYLKLVPASSGSAPAPGSSSAVYGKLGGQELCLFYEPYSYSLHGFHDAETMNEVMLQEFIRLRPQEISIQTVRIGMKSLHHSRFLERLDLPAEADDRTVNDDPARLAAGCDILRETVRALEGTGIRLTANVGMNRPYLWIPPLAERFTREHASLVRDGDFDYTRPEVQDYAKAVLGELVREYAINGLLLDYMRSPKNQTADSLVGILRAAKAMLKEKEAVTGSRMDLKVRIPAVHPVYFEAMEQGVAEGLVDVIIPSNFMTSDPLPRTEHYVQLCRSTGTRVFGCIDGWKWLAGIDPKAGALTMAHTPRDLKATYEAYRKQHVQGVYLYQADLIGANPYLYDLFT